MVVAVWEKPVFLGTPEGELENPHARQIKLAPQSIDGPRNDAQIFRDQRQRAEGGLQCGEKIYAGTRNPRTRLRGLASRGDGPVSLESAEMIESNEIDQL